MKLPLILLGLTMALAAHAQTGSPAAGPPDTRRNVVKISPLVAVGHVSAFYERVVAPRTSVVVGVGFGGESYPYRNNSTQVPEPGRYHYERLTLEGRRYLGRHGFAPFQAPFGFFVGGYSRYARLSIRDYTFDRDKFVRDAAGNLVLLEKQTFVTTLGGYVGYQTGLFRRCVTLESFFGLQAQLSSAGVISSQSLPEAMSTSGLVGRLGLTVGYAF